MRHYIRSVLHPEAYHGHDVAGPFFEGWYFKLIDKTENHRIAIIPGIFKGKDPTHDHTFIQILDGMAGTSTYHQFPVTQFSAATDHTFDVRIGENHFSNHSLSLNLSSAEQVITGHLSFGPQIPWSVTYKSPGVMGPFAWIPQMECYHGVLSFNHEISGSLNIDNQVIDFTGGKGYLEKDWGKGFPEGYVWMQSNHFDTYDTSIETAIAIIPWFLGTSFRGIQCGFWHAGQLYRFTTYTDAHLERFKITDHSVYITYQDSKYRLEVAAERADGALLHAPIRTEMHKRVKETLKATIHVRLTTRVGNITTTLYSGTGRAAGLEVHGNLERLLSYSQ